MFVNLAPDPPAASTAQLVCAIMAPDENSAGHVEESTPLPHVPMESEVVGTPHAEGDILPNVPAPGPELVFGLVSPVGTKDDMVLRCLSELLVDYGYDPRLIRVSGLIENLPDLPQPEESNPEHVRLFNDRAALDRDHLHHRDVRIGELQRFGNAYCEYMGAGDALMSWVILAIRNLREQITGGTSVTAQRVAYIIRSIKRPDEVKRLRQIYRDRFVLLAAHSSRSLREATLISQIENSRKGEDPIPNAPSVQTLIEHDESDEHPYGQRVRRLFELADCIVNAEHEQSCRSSLERFIEVIFETKIHTPTRDEAGVFHSWTVSLQSSSLSRQVGAVIADHLGAIVSVGCNEVARAGGSVYWEDEILAGAPDGRDHSRAQDESTERKRSLAVNLLLRVEESLSSDESGAQAAIRQLRQDILEGETGILENSLVSNIIEFQRAVHAEANALLSAARRGVQVEGLTLYCTTFPCHECAKAIVAAGITRVVYLEPYPKSLTLRLFDDSIRQDDCDDGRVPFDRLAGIAPRRYARFFARNQQHRLLSLAELPKRQRLPEVLEWISDEDEKHSLAAEVLFIESLKDKMDLSTNN